MSQFTQIPLSVIYARYCKIQKQKPNSRLEILLREETFCRNGTIDLSSNYFGARGVIPVLECVKRSADCTSLVLSGNGLDNDSVKYVCSCLRGHPSLERIDLGDNDEISLGGVDDLIELIAENERIVDVNLEGTGVSLKFKMMVREALLRNQLKQKKKRRLLGKI